MEQLFNYLLDWADQFHADHHPDDLVISGKVIAQSQRGAIGQEWWGQAWVAAMERLGLDGRLQRGRSYARNGSVRDLRLGYGQVSAKVKGSSYRPYDTHIYLKPFSPEQWTHAIQALSEQAIYAAQLLAGEMPADIEDIFQGVKLSLFPRSKRDIQFECSCPDWGDPCKHAAAVYYLVAEQLDANPFILFHLRGCSRELLLQQLRELRGETVIEEMNLPLEADLTTFWGREFGQWDSDLPQPQAYALQRWGYPPGQANPHWQTIYTDLSLEAWRWLGLEEDG